jgi:hypothetical protein
MKNALLGLLLSLLSTTVSAEPIIQSAKQSDQEVISLWLKYENLCKAYKSGSADSFSNCLTLTALSNILVGRGWCENTLADLENRWSKCLVGVGGGTIDPTETIGTEGLLSNPEFIVGVGQNEYISPVQ